MKRAGVALLLLSCSLFSQFHNRDYPNWFLDPPDGGYVVGLARNVSIKSETLKEAWLDALAMYDLYHKGVIRTNVIGYKNRLADSLMLKLSDEIEFPKGVRMIKSATISTLFIGLFEVSYQSGSTGSSVKNDFSQQEKIMAIGKQTIHPDRLYESWASAEIEAFKELSRSKKSKVRSISKKTGSRFEELIFLQSETPFNNARVERRWIENNVANVQVSDVY